MSNQRFSDFPIATSVNTALDYIPFAQWNGAGYTEMRVKFSFVQGPPGNNGTAPTFTSLSASALAYGATPTATLGGTFPSYTIAFGIPVGPPGTGNVSMTGTITSGAPVVWSGTSGMATSATLPWTVAQGGTNASSASGTALDNITGFSGTGLLNRTGAGAYSFVATSTLAASSVTVTGGSGLTGGGALTGNQTITVASNGITNAMLAQMGSLTLKGNITGAPANAADSAVTAVIDAAFGSTRGMVLFRGASAWTALAAGTSGNVLQTNGSSADPTWVSPPTSSPFPSAFAAKSANYTVVSGDTGTQFSLSGTFTLSLPSGATMGAGKGIFISKTDGSGTVTITPASGTIDGLSSIKCYQERFSLVSDGTNWFSIDRAKGWIPLSNVTLTGQTLSNINIAIPLNDPEMWVAEIDYVSLVANASQFPNMAFTGVSSVTYNGIYNDGSSLTAFGGATNISFGGSSSYAATANLSGKIIMKAGHYETFSKISSGASTTTFGYGTGTPSAAVITPSSGTWAGITYFARLYRQ